MTLTVTVTQASIADLIEQRDWLLEALVDLLCYHHVPGPVDAVLAPLMRAGFAAIAKASPVAGLTEIGEEEVKNSMASQSKPVLTPKSAIGEAERRDEALRLLAGIWFYGRFSAETRSERRLAELMEGFGLWPLPNEAALFAALDRPRAALQPVEPRRPDKLRARDLSDAELVAEQTRVEKLWDAMYEPDEDGEVFAGHGGSPGEWMVERMDEVATEQARRDGGRDYERSARRHNARDGSTPQSNEPST